MPYDLPCPWQPQSGCSSHKDHHSLPCLCWARLVNKAPFPFQVAWPRTHRRVVLCRHLSWSGHPTDAHIHSSLLALQVPTAWGGVNRDSAQVVNGNASTFFQCRAPPHPPASPCGRATAVRVINGNQRGPSPVQFLSISQCRPMRRVQQGPCIAQRATHRLKNRKSRPSMLPPACVVGGITSAHLFNPVWQADP